MCYIFSSSGLKNIKLADFFATNRASGDLAFLHGGRKPSGKVAQAWEACRPGDPWQCQAMCRELPGGELNRVFYSEGNEALEQAVHRTRNTTVSLASDNSVGSPVSPLFLNMQRKTGQ